jgi:hypothetical protein
MHLFYGALVCGSNQSDYTYVPLNALQVSACLASLIVSTRPDSHVHPSFILPINLHIATSEVFFMFLRDGIAQDGNARF